MGCQRVLVFVYTHSNPENGDLHIKKNEAVTASNVSSTDILPLTRSLRHCRQFLDLMFGSALSEFTARTSSILVMLACSGLYSNKNSYACFFSLESCADNQNGNHHHPPPSQHQWRRWQAPMTWPNEERTQPESGTPTLWLRGVCFLVL